MWEKLEQALSENPEQAAVVLIDLLAEGGDPHQLFDARLMKWKLDAGLPLTHPTSVADVPAEKKSDFEKIYISAGNEVGQILLSRNQFADAWMYFRAIGEKQAMIDALEKYSPPAEIDDNFEEVLQLALYQGIHPAEGVQLMLDSHGMCNTVTAMDQVYLEMSPADRSRTAEIMVRQLYKDLLNNVRYEVEQREPMLEPDLSLGELITARQWMFENDNYHTDVSHLNSVVRFARALEATQKEALNEAIQLSEYGAKLSPQLQYPGEPPFDDYYVAHQHYFQIVADVNREESLKFFQDRLESAPDSQDQELIAYVLVDLLMRLDQHAEAIQIAEKYLQNVHEQSGFSFVALCEDTGDMQALARHAQNTNNPVMFVAAKLSKQ